MVSNEKDIIKLPHHERLDVCTSRARYRQGRKFTAVKVYTINDESQHLIVCGVPALGLQDELQILCSRYGGVKSLVFIPGYEQDEFSEAYHVLYDRIQSARFAKNQLDDKSYFGGVLHVCYAPEMESVSETREKLIQRRKDIAKRTRGNHSIRQNKGITKQYHRQKKHPALPITAERLSVIAPQSECIWQGIPQDIDPRMRHLGQGKLETVYGPQKPDKKLMEAGVREQRIVPFKKCTPSPLHCPSPFHKAISNVKFTEEVPPLSAQVLRFIPSQVKSTRRIVYHKRIQREQMADYDDALLKENPTFAEDNLSVEETIRSVRKKIKAVSVPSIQVVLENKQHE